MMFSHLLRIQTTATAWLAVAACALGADQPAPAPTQPRPLASHYQSQPPKRPLDDLYCYDRKDEGYTEISIERTGCYGPCPQYTLILRSDGTARWIGYKDVVPLGERTGKFDSGYFFELSNAAARIGFFDKLSTAYSCSITDQATVFVSAVRQGQRKTISHYAPDVSGPVELYLFEEALDYIATKIAWQR